MKIGHIEVRMSIYGQRRPRSKACNVTRRIFRRLFLAGLETTIQWPGTIVLLQTMHCQKPYIKMAVLGHVTFFAQIWTHCLNIDSVDTHM